MTTFILWMILLVLCWPLELLALVLYPIVWLMLLPFKLFGFAVGGILVVLMTIVLLPVKILSAIAKA